MDTANLEEKPPTPAEPDETTSRRKRRNLRVSPDCLNCGEPVPLNFCPRCGQENVQMVVPVKHLFGDIVDELFKLDSRLFRSLKYLITRPGFLTNEYIAGRRARYVAPFRFYFIVSAVWFLLSSLTGLQAQLQKEIDKGSVVKNVKVTDKSPKPTAGTKTSAKPAMTEADQLRMIGKVENSAKGMGRWLLGNESWLALTMSPAIAFVLSILYFRSRRMYIEHLVFAVHFSAFVFTLWFAMFIPWLRGWRYSDWIFIGGPLVYLFFAMRTVYAQGPIKTFFKEGLLAAGCGCLGILFAIGVFAVIVLRAMSS